jgi:endonuclease YncB( thermonuclease family)
MRYIVLLAFLAAFSIQPAFAQKTPAKNGDESAPAATSSLPDRIARPMIAIDPVTLKAEGFEIRLWGIKPASSSDSSLELKALDLLDDRIDGQVVNCKIEGGQLPVLSGRCVVQASSDLALELLNNGLAVRDRRQTYNTPFASAYGQAEEFARLNKKGVWRYLAEGEKTQGGTDMSGLLTLAVIVSPLLGMLLVGGALWFWLSRMSRAQQADSDAAKRKEAILQARERQVLLTTIEGELVENKNKTEAFLVIYGDMLRSLSDTNEVPKYQQVGDIVQKYPSFSKTVFEANVNKLSLLGIKLAGQLSKLYAAIPKDQEYINLEPGVPLETAMQLVQKVMKDAEAMLPEFDTAIQALQVAAQQKSD